MSAHRVLVHEGIAGDGILRYVACGGVAMNYSDYDHARPPFHS